MTQKKTILVVDDDDAHRTMLRTLVGGWGYDIVEADDGSTAIEKVQEQLFEPVWIGGDLQPGIGIDQDRDTQPVAFDPQ